MFRRWFIGVFLLIVLLVSSFAPSEPPVFAQGCNAMETALQQAEDRCNSIWENGACYGYATLSYQFKPGAVTPGFKDEQYNRNEDIADFEWINAGNTGIAVMALLPAGASNYVRLTMFGGATVGLDEAPDRLTLDTGEGGYCSDMPAVMVAHTKDGQSSQVVINNVLIELQSTAVITRQLKPIGGAAGTSGVMLFASNRDGNWEIYTMDITTQSTTRLTFNGVFDYGARFSPDGTQIAYQSGPEVDASGTLPGTELYVMNSDGTNPRRLTNNPVGDGLPSWSPDGTRLVFASMRDGNQEIYTMNVNDLSVTRLTNNAATDTWPVWSPDGSQIAFFRQSGNQSHIFVMNSNGSGERQLTFGGDYDRAPSWSPDGSQIAFVSTRDDPVGYWHVYVVGSAGGTPYRITQQNSWAPTWTPDGQIIHMSNRDGDQELFIINADGGNERRLTNNTAHDEHPDMAFGQASVTADVMTVANRRGTVFVIASGQTVQLFPNEAVDINLSTFTRPVIVGTKYTNSLLPGYPLIGTAENTLDGVGIQAPIE